ncbi:MAG: hypothetical protein AB7R89_30570 [Dehalococcoidia bacterium]
MAHAERVVSDAQQPVDRRQVLRLIARGGAAAGVAAVAVGAMHGSAGAQATDVIGSWITYIHLDDPPEDDIHMMTLAPGGILLFSSESPLIPSPLPGLEEFWWNSGHGAWEQAADGTVQGQFVVVVQDRNQRPVYFACVRPRLRLAGPDMLTGRFTFDFIPIGETEPAVTLGASIEAERVRADG